ncbi:hypothetical protein [Bosea sp. TAF32]|uniref:hypothetical protein n=1 Tax=Bosea sp. TAF32 TaxID=3237482 RepID=UPI003F917F20
MSVEATIREKLSEAMSQARQRERATLIEQGATDEELAAFEAARDPVWTAWAEEAVALVLRQDSDAAALTGQLQ